MRLDSLAQETRVHPFFETSRGHRSLEGDHSLYAGEFLERHSSFWRLTDRGREQALKTGEWLRENVDGGFDGFFSSEYLRAMETIRRAKAENVDADIDLKALMAKCDTIREIRI